MKGTVSYNSRIQPGVAHVLDAGGLALTMRTGDFHSVDERPMGGMTGKGFPPFNSPLFQFVLAAHDVEVTTIWVFANPDRQGQPPVTFLADHPIVHVAQPVHFTIIAEGRIPVDLIDHIHDLVAQAGLFFGYGDFVPRLIVKGAHADKPLIDKTVNQLFAAAPAVRIAMGVALLAVVKVSLVQVLKDIRRNGVNVTTTQPGEAFDVNAAFVEGCDHG